MNEFDGHDYVEFCERGEYTRHAKTIGELPTPELRLAACKRASEILGLNIQFGIKVGLTNKLIAQNLKMTKPDCFHCAAINYR
ncbi:hypothetical protein [Cellvibrio sp. QJXJ]|uniref:hypothetical protein n=1 Tax=Cellvibrio sp. QJXJ TaxID=2964606 RepID=UPI0021C3CFF5|nr:hypothetical protein [Cellvibrio sp. QJXJ]UUA75221.1 hypothetical protein NNX04_22445 [Cellvibrio sp. QJXJ]